MIFRTSVGHDARMASVRRGGRGRRAGRHRHRVRARRRRGVRTLLCRPAPTRAGPPMPARASSRRTRPSATTRAWVDLVPRSPARTTSSSVPNLPGDTGWARCGILQARDARQRRAGVGVGRGTGTRRDRDQSADDARAMVPVLGEIVSARCSTRGGAGRRAQLASHCARAAVELGVEARTGAIDDVVARRRDRRRARRSPADAVVIAGGAWSRRAREISSASTLPVDPVRGQIVHLGVDGHDTGAWPIVQPVFGYYMVPWADARVAVGATVEDAGFDARRHRRAACTKCCARRCASCPGSPPRRCAKCASGSGPVSADDMPILGAAPRRTTTCSSRPATAPNGLLLGPVSGALVADLCRPRPRTRPRPLRTGALSLRFSARA